MLLARLVEVSGEVAATSKRLLKRDLIAGLLTDVAPEGPDALDLAATYLSGTLRQRRTGLGWRSLQDLPPPAETPSVTLEELDHALVLLSTLAGAGSAATRRDAAADLFGRLTDGEQRWLRAVLTEGVRQGAQDSVLLDAVAQAAGLPPAEVRRAAMFSAPTGPIAAAALGRGSAALAEFAMLVGRPVRPMLAGTAPDVAAGLEKVVSVAGDAVAVDTKLDGIRIQVHKRGDEVTVLTRSLDDVTERLSTVVEVVRGLPAHDLVLDGEALVIGDDGRPRPFQETASSTATHAGAGGEGGQDGAAPYFFDLLLHDDTSLVEVPAVERLARLDAVVPEQHRAPRLVTDSADEAQAFFDDAIARGHEGVVLKRLDAPYDAGRRGSAWIKVKPRHTLDLVVLAVEWGSGRRRGLLSNIHLGAQSPDGLVMLGKTFKGMTDEILAWQTERFLGLETHREGHVVHVRPEQVVEIAFDGVQRSTRYPGGVALRFARVLRYRDDKGPAEADTLGTVRSHLP